MRACAVEQSIEGITKAAWNLRGAISLWFAASNECKATVFAGPRNGDRPDSTGSTGGPGNSRGQYRLNLYDVEMTRYPFGRVVFRNTRVLIAWFASAMQTDFALCGPGGRLFVG